MQITDMENMLRVSAATRIIDPLTSKKKKKKKRLYLLMPGRRESE